MLANLPLLKKFLPISVILGVFTLGWISHDWWVSPSPEKVHSEIVKQVKAQETLNHNISNGYTAKLLTYTEDAGGLIHDTQKETQGSQYSACRLPANGVRLLNTAVQQANSFITP